MRLRRAALAILATTLLLPGAAGAAAAPKTNLADLEDEVMCTVCGTLLELSDSPQANQERAFIRQRIAHGETKQQIEDELVAQYGREVLAVPPASGFDLTAYLVPAVAFVLAVLGIAVGMRRWRRRAAGEPVGAPLDPAEAERLDADLARYDL